MFSPPAVGKLIIRERHVRKMALDWTWKMERRWYKKICGRLTCCSEKRQRKQEVRRVPIFVVGEAHAMIPLRQPCLKT
jgi:hypothetical protein